MGDNYWDNDNDDQQNGRGGGQLREQLEQALKDNKALKAQVATLTTQVSATSLTKSLTDKGYKPGLAKRAASDGVTDEAGLDKWLEENSDWLPDPVTPTDETDATVDESANEPAPEVVQAQYEATDLVTSLNAVASPAEVNRFNAALKSIPEDASPEAVLASLRAAGS